MRKYAKVLTWATGSLVIIIGITLLCSPSVRLRREVMQQVPIVRECYPLVKPYLETLRTGQAGRLSEGCRVYYDKMWDKEIMIGKPRNEVSPLSENKFNLPPEEIVAINYLMKSPELPLNCTFMIYPEEMAAWDAGVPGGGGVFYEDSSAMVGVFRFEDNRVPEELMSQHPYYEELGDNYWLLAFKKRRD